MHGMAGMAVLAALVFAALLAVGMIDGNRFVVVKKEFCLPRLSKGCRFVLISDLHNKVYGNKNDKVIKAVRKINPDFIVLAGDLVTSKESEDMAPGIELVRVLARDYRVYYGLGNHESKIRQCRERFGDKFDRLREGLADRNIIMLTNQAVDIPEYNIRMTGLELGLEYFGHLRIKKMEPDYLRAVLPAPGRNKCNILIAHNPDYFEAYAGWGADLALSGHVHGGIMRLPVLGGVIAPTYVLFPEYDGGVFRTGKSVMLLGRGMGSHTIPLRFFNPAELYEVSLKPEK